MLLQRIAFSLTILLATACLSSAQVVVNYVVDAGGNNNNPLNGLSARGTFTVNGNRLTILLENTSAGVPDGFDSAASLLVSLAMNLPDVTFVSGDVSVIGPGSIGLGEWAGLIEGDSVADEWVWTNDFGGDLLESFQQVISTSMGQGGGDVEHFAGGSGNIDGPFGGIAASPPTVSLPDTQRAVSDSIHFELTLSAVLTDDQLAAAARSSMVEFGSDERYLRVPEPTTFWLLVLAAFTRLGRNE